MKKEIQNLRNWVNKHNKILMPLSLVLGFVIDSLTLNRIDRAFENIIFIVYLLFAIFGIFVFNYFSGRARKNNFLEKIYIFSPLLIQFMFGGLFSGFAVFYLRSGSITSSWFFILIILVLMLGNDIFKKKYEHFVFQITVFFIGLFFYMIFAIPVLLKVMNEWVFILSGVVSLILVSLVILIFSYLLKDQVKKSLKYLIPSIVIFFVFINILYFANIIPPIPLSLKTGDVYHNVTKIDGGYLVQYEHSKSLLNLNHKINISPYGTVYAYSAVFAPTKISTNIVHNWEHYNTENKKWESVSRVEFPIYGGRDVGYRGYSYKTNTQEGKWRVLVETSRGQIIGKISFKVLYTNNNLQLEEKVL